MDVTHGRRQIRFCFSAVIDRHDMTLSGELPHDVWAEEFGATYDNDAHRVILDGKCATAGSPHNAPCVPTSARTRLKPAG